MSELFGYARFAELAALPVPPFARCEVTVLPLFTGGALAGEDPARVLAEARRSVGASPPP